MSDRELLELAAKAAGYNEPNWPPRYDWNPLTDDGDALRLAVKLRMHVHADFDCGERHSAAEALYFSGPEWNCSLVREQGADENAATRRAIVRAVAEIGRAM